MKRPTMLVEAILHQAEIDLDLSVERDVDTIRRRCEHEGFSFLTITLPTLSDSLERGLECGLFSCPTSFSRHGRLPRFLGGFFKSVFSSEGELLDNACPYAIAYIRQICRFFKKPKMACQDPRKEIEAAQHFINVEAELSQVTPDVLRPDKMLDTISSLIWSQVFPEIDPLELVCRHGPGATAEKLGANARYEIRSWNARSELLFPSDLHAYPNYWAASEVSGTGIEPTSVGLKYLDVRDEPPVRVVFVPKTQVAPRVIAIEPSHVQYMQQSLKDYVYKVLESHSLTRSSIRFSRQEPNQILAHRSSIDKRLATLDLKDASDRVHLHLVQRIFKNSGILEYLEDCRSLHATLPDGRNVVLSKFASMGSAMCFPVEAMVFYTLIQSAMHQVDGRRPSSSSIRRYSAMIDVYGDDLIVPVDYTDVVVRYLESYALKVNVSKSFSKGNFRESCGADYYKGVAVNPVYARRYPHDNSRDWEADDLLSWNATADHFYVRGQWHVAQVIRDMLSRVVRSSIPRSTKFGSGLVHHSFLFSTGLRWNRDLQSWKQRRITFHPTLKKDKIDGSYNACLNKWGIHTLNGSHESSVLDRYSNGPRHANVDVREVCETKRFFIQRLPDGDVGLSHIEHRYELSGSSICKVSEDQYAWDQELPVSERLARDDLAVCAGLSIVRTRTESGTYVPGRLAADHYLTEVASDPLKALFGLTEGLDFQSSTKSGVLKSKRRWVSLAG